MEGKARFIFPVLMSGQMVLMVTCLVTFLNLGMRADFFAQWMRAFIISWPVAAGAAFLAIPVARRATKTIVGLIDG
jgi:Protein of unknown function (DUF2798)